MGGPGVCDWPDQLWGTVSAAPSGSNPGLPVLQHSNCTQPAMLYGLQQVFVPSASQSVKYDHNQKVALISLAPCRATCFVPQCHG